MIDYIECICKILCMEKIMSVNSNQANLIQASLNNQSQALIQGVSHAVDMVLITKMNTLNEELQKAIAANAKLQEEYKDLDRALQSYQKFLNDSEDKGKKLQEKIDILSKQILEVKAANEKLTATSRKLEEEKKGFDRVEDNLKQRLLDENKSNEKLRLQNLQQLKEIEALKEKETTLQEHSRREAAQSKEIQQQMREKIQQYANELKETHETVKYLRGRIEWLSSKLKEEETLHEQARYEIEDAKLENTSLRNRLVEYDEQLKLAVEAENRLKAANTSHLSQQRDMRKQIEASYKKEQDLSLCLEDTRKQLKAETQKSTFEIQKANALAAANIQLMADNKMQAETIEANRQKQKALEDEVLLLKQQLKAKELHPKDTQQGDKRLNQPAAAVSKPSDAAQQKSSEDQKKRRLRRDPPSDATPGLVQEPSSNAQFKRPSPASSVIEKQDAKRRKIVQTKPDGTITISVFSQPDTTSTKNV